MADKVGNEPEGSSTTKPQIEPIRLPTVEEIRGQDIWNNCAMRSVFSGVMGMAIAASIQFLIQSIFFTST